MMFEQQRLTTLFGRFAKNPWEGDGFLKCTIDMFIFITTSIVKTITNSDDIRAKFKAQVEIVESSKNVRASRIKDLHSAKQRYSSHQKPLGRLILYFDAIVAVAYEIMTRRTGDKANRARVFLQTIN